MKLSLLSENAAQTNGWILYHGSDSPQIVGTIRANERDSGWFGAGFYLTAFTSYAKRWGKFIYRMSIPRNIKFVEIQIIGNYDKINYFGDAQLANQAAGGDSVWIENEHAYSIAFTAFLKQHGYGGIRTHMDDNKDVEVVVFNPSNITVIDQVNDTVPQQI